MISTDSRTTIFNQLSQLVAFNSVHGDPALADQAAGAAQWVVTALEESPIEFEVSSHLTVDGSRAIIGYRAPEANQPTVLLYCHHDVVPAGELSAWESDPFTLTERNGRWYGRGTADCKGNLVMHLEALRQLATAEAADPTAPKIGLIFLAEGSEEMGGEGLDQLLADKPELFRSDVILIADSGNAAVGIPTLTTSLRGGAQLTVTVRTLDAAVHSGMFGGAAPDAVFALMRTLDSLRDEKGRTVIDGVDTTTRWEGRPYDPENFRTDSTTLPGVELAGDESDNPADFIWARPAVTVTGFTSTPVSQAVNAIPPMAQARLNLRVPAGIAAAEIAEKLAAHLKAHVPGGAHIEVEIEDINDGFASDLSQPAIQLFQEALSAAYDGAEVVSIGSGGSIPLTGALQQQFPQAEIALFGVEEPESRIHSANESVDPTEIERIAAAEFAFLTKYSQAAAANTK
ncbi:M20/M25/M40 family metallo-hydrolase [Corynebacterium caspium]|uniref:M20/M25/M40 family metallo-hydrolase n=1 Tax=Corynebacterium caspium TaxID=234828 RepID=UPI00035F6AC7|nr:M20/M25/M40 family metallo-hydrolase [Corynebacterium caspium]WKD58681.1 putative succinyl-diaminopimelate desuccinylase [Corynebacterium caspium DSM 44850]